MATFDLFVLSIFVFFGYLMFGMATAKMLSEEGTIFAPATATPGSSVLASASCGHCSS